MDIASPLSLRRFCFPAASTAATWPSPIRGVFGALTDTEKLDGVSEVISGFTGLTANPRYEPGKWGDHRETAQVTRPEFITFEKLVRHVWLDYEDVQGQFCDRGRSYSCHLLQDRSERLIAERLAPKNLVPIEPESDFYPVRRASRFL